MGYDNVGNILNDVALELALVSSADADPMASTNSVFVRLRALLKSKGRELLRLRDWTQLRAEYTFTTSTGTNNYALPSDFRALVNQTLWNRTNQQPLAGPVTAQTWQRLKGQVAGAVVTIPFRVYGGQLQLYGTVPDAQTLALEYATSYWLAVQATPTTPAQDAPALSSDVVLFDPLLMVRALKLATLRAMGFDSTAAQQDYEATLATAMSDDSPSPLLSLNRGSDVNLISEANLPQTGYAT